MCRGTPHRAEPCSVSPQIAGPRTCAVDNRDGLANRGVDVERGGIEQVRVGRRFQGGDGALHVALVTPQDVGQHIRLVHHDAVGRQRRHAAPGAHLGGGVDEDFHVRLRTDHRTDVAPVEHSAGRHRREGALELHQRGAHARHGRDDGGGLRHAACLERRFIELPCIEALGGHDRARLVIQSGPCIDEALGHCPVEQAGVEVSQPEMSRETLGKGPFAGRGRSIDGDDHAMFAPSERISSTNPGKLVAMNAASSTATGCSLASPITRADMAMRWSIWVATCPPPAALPSPVPTTSPPATPTSTPLIRRMAAVAASRSDSFPRSSLRPRITVTPPANAAATLRTGYSSIMVGARSAGTSTPLSGEARTRRSATSSPPSLRTSSTSMAAPISRSVVSRPVRSGLVMTLSSTTSEPSVMRPPTTRKPAAARSPPPPTPP